MPGPVPLNGGDNVGSSTGGALSGETVATPDQKRILGYQLGGQYGGADADVNRFRAAATNEANTAAPVPNYAGGDMYATMGGQARVGSGDALSLMRQRAMGIHTAADATADRGNAQAMAAQHSISMAARGPAALAGSPQQYAATVSRMMTDNANNKAYNNAQDTALAQGQLSQGYGQMRGQDMSAQHVNDARTQFGDDLSMRNQAMNNAGQLGYEKMGFGANQARLEGEQLQGGANLADWTQRSNSDEFNTTQDTGNAIKYGGAAANGAGALGGAIAANGGGSGPAYNYSDPNSIERTNPYGGGGDSSQLIDRNNPYDTNSDARVKKNITKENYAAEVLERKAAAMRKQLDSQLGPNTLERQANDMRRNLDAQLGAPSSKMLEGIGGTTSFTYKPGFENPGQVPGEKNYGLLTQDLKKSDMGRSLLAAPAPDGVERVDVRKAAMASLAASADIHQRLKKVEARTEPKDYAADVLALKTKHELASQKVTDPDEAQRRGLVKSGVIKDDTAAVALPAPMPPNEGLGQDDEVRALPPPMPPPPAAVSEEVEPLPPPMPPPPAEVPEPTHGYGSGDAAQYAALVNSGVVNGQSPDRQNLVASDPKVKEAVQDVGIPVEEAITNRTDELVAKAKNHPVEAGRELATLDRETSRLGLPAPQLPAPQAPGLPAPQLPAPQLPAPQVPRGNLMGAPLASGLGSDPSEDPIGPAGGVLRRMSTDVLDRAKDALTGGLLHRAPAGPALPPTVAEQYLRKAGTAVKSFIKSGQPETPWLGKPKAAEPQFGGRVSDTPTAGLEGVDPATLAEPPAPRPGNATAEREHDPLPPPAPTYANIPAHYVDTIGPKAWAALSEQDRAALTAADEIHTRAKEQNADDLQAAEYQKQDADVRAMNAAETGKNMHAESENRMHEIDADAKALAGYHEDPNKFWNSRSTGQKVAGFIGIALGGFAQGLHGGHNPALDQINKAVDDDISAQRHNYMANKDSLDAKRSAYGMAMEKYKDDFMAQNVVRVAALDKVSAEAAAAKAKWGGIHADDNANLFQADLAKQRAERIIAFQKYAQAQTVRTDGMTDKRQQQLDKEYGEYYTDTTKKGELTPQTRAVWMRGRLGGETQAGLGRASDRPNADKDRERTVVIGGKEVLAINKKNADDYAEYSKIAPEAKRLVAEMQDARKGGPNENVAKYEAAQHKLIEVMPAVFGFGRGPSVAQVEHTFGTESIPSFVHSPFGGVGVAKDSKGSHHVALTSRANDKLDDLQKTLETIDKSTIEATIGPQSGGAAAGAPKESFKESK